MISIIIPCYWATTDLIETTIKCINSLNDTTDKEPSECLIIDDASPHELELIDTTDWAQRFEVISRNRNGGYAAAVNTGLFYSKGDPIIICNNDIEFIQPDWLNHLLIPLENYDICSIRTSDTDGYLTKNRLEEGAKFGSIWAMRRKVYETIGGLSEEFGRGYFEDLDYQRRAEDAGFKVIKNHAGLVEHTGKATFKEVDPSDDAFIEARKLFIKKWGGVW